SYYEDMYVQASEHFPGIWVDMENRTMGFSMDRFIEEFEEVLAHFEEPDYFDISKTYSNVYHRFLQMDLSNRPAIRGQLEGPISFGLNVLDQDKRPILFNETVRAFLLDFMARRLNAQLGRLKAMNPNAFMFVDEPGLQYIFSAMSGYDGVAGKQDMEGFFAAVDRPRGVHLCGNPDWDFLLGLDLDVLSLDVYSNGEIFTSYAGSILRFLKRGGRIVWGIVPTNFEPFSNESVESLEKRLLECWRVLEQHGIDRELLLSQSLLSPATCCLVNHDGEVTVEKAFSEIRALSQVLRERFRLPG
ncbi:MAG: hypothetical protein ACP5SH_06870, partial [Syntrophobacteraceae bacterium]